EGGHEPVAERVERGNAEERRHGLHHEMGRAGRDVDAPDSGRMAARAVVDALAHDPEVAGLKALGARGGREERGGEEKGKEAGGAMRHVFQKRRTSRNRTGGGPLPSPRRMTGAPARR